MMKYLKLLRIHQWYKNLVVFLALFFTRNIFDPSLVATTVLAFCCLCLTSSSYYILNDIKDAKADKSHPEKKKRPIPSGKVSVNEARVISGILLVASLIIAGSISVYFLAFPILLFLSAQLYNIRLKDIAILDIHMIALNFLIRAVSGAVAINVKASSWLIMTVFFLALLLGIGKRRSELGLLGDHAVKFKVVYEVYSRDLLDKMLIMVASILLFAYSLYTFFVHQDGYMMLTIPFASFIIFRYIHLASVDHKIARKTEYIFTDPQILVAFMLWVLTSFTVLYMLGA
ncbi:UbiA prenyltransferase family protein [Candidatus Altiarchaeota archaeon]